MPDQHNNQKDVNNPHDKFFKSAFGITAVVEPFLHQFVPKNILETLDLNTLKLESTSYITDELSEYYADLVWSCQSNNHRHKTEIAFLFEHKSYKPSHPHFQLIDYKRNSWKQKLAINQKPVPMIPIIFYHGQVKWVVEPFDSYFGDVEPELLRFMPCFDYLLVNMQDYPDELIKTFQSVLLQKALLSFKHHLDTNYLKTHIVEILFSGYDDIKNENIRSFIRILSVYLSTVTGMTRQTIIAEANRFNNNQKFETMDIIEELLEEGKKMAIYQSWQRGNSIELLSDVFGLSVKEIQLIISEITNQLENNSN